MPSVLQGEPIVGSRPHQQAGSGSATRHCQRPAVHVQSVPPPHAPPVDPQRSPSTEHAVGRNGFTSGEHAQMPPAQPVSVAVNASTRVVASTGIPLSSVPRVWVLSQAESVARTRESAAMEGLFMGSLAENVGLTRDVSGALAAQDHAARMGSIHARDFVRIRSLSLGHVGPRA
jgi:hypothetical protein